MKNTISKPRILLAIPVYNEVQYIDAVLDKVTRYIDRVLVVDDGSNDGSKETLSRREDICFMSYPDNRGYGQTIIDTFHLAHSHNYDWVITMDCDLQHEPERIPDFIAAIQNSSADVVSGSRYMKDARRENCPPPDRQRINQIVSAMINERLGLELTDSFCGFRACNVAKMEELELTEPGYAFPLEFWVQIVKHHFTVEELPVSLIYNDPNRYFGGNLDDAEIRLAHYKAVFQAALDAAGMTENK